MSEVLYALPIKSEHYKMAPYVGRMDSSAHESYQNLYAVPKNK